ncbi:MAG: hypothetical protein HC859_17595, partial [Bacteroidia bacterium]|nr:hypothetical protein [Bacteroidia bacterium]
NISSDLPNVNIGDANIKDISAPALDGIPQVPGTENLGSIGDITQQAGQYGNDVKAIASGDLGEVKQVPELIENKVGEMADVKGLQDQASQIPINPAMSEEEAKAQIKEQVKKVAVDHFAGHEDKLKEAMDKIAKYKQKYSEVQSLKDLPKRVPNAMKGKPLRERLVPGVTLQFQRKNDYLLDVSPSIGYRFSGRITGGLGWNQRWRTTTVIATLVPGRASSVRAHTASSKSKGIFHPCRSRVHEHLCAAQIQNRSHRGQP